MRRVVLDNSQVYQDSKDSQDLLVQRESQRRRVILDCWGPLDFLGVRATLDNLELKE